MELKIGTSYNYFILMATLKVSNIFHFNGIKNIQECQIYENRRKEKKYHRRERKKEKKVKKFELILTP